MTEMQSSELKSILFILKNKTLKGVGIFTLSNETKIPPYDLRQYLSKYSDYFVNISDKHKFKINRFGRFKGDIDDILEFHQVELEKESSKYFWVIYLALISTFISVGTVFSIT